MAAHMRVAFVAAGAGQDRVLGGHHEHPGVGHHSQRLGRREVAVFDAADPGPHGALDAFVAVTVRGDRDVEVGGRRDQNIHLLLAVGGVPGVVRR